MDYEKLYEKAVERAKTLTNSGFNDFDFVKHIFPELKESEDERIRKAIINEISLLEKESVVEQIKNVYQSWIAWLEKQGKIVDYYEDRLDECACKYFNKGYKQALEKQGEQKPADVRTIGYWHVEDAEQKPADKVEPKFKVKYAGCEYNVLEVKDIAGVTYYGIEDEPNHIDYVKADNCKIISGGYGIKENGSPYPTKTAVFSEQKSSWSEEDEIALDDALWCCKQAANIAKDENDMGNVWYAERWLKSLKERVQPQPNQEWRKEDEAHLHSLIIHLEQWIERHHNTTGADIQGENIAWLKSLRPKNKWKPSDEQIGVIEAVINNRSFQRRHLDSLYEQLKKLKED